jgi:predicted DCC family thiol-disulfide oxidoreductase YuxK
MINHAAPKPSSEASSAEQNAFIIYDGECPFCSAYVKLMKLKEAVGAVRLIDAREGGLEVEAARQAAFDLNEGMVFFYGGRFYHGAEAVNAMALLSGRSSFLNRLNAVLFRSATFSRLSYPLLRAGRNAALRLRGKSALEV